MGVMSKKNERPTRLLWMDLEMTGLDAQKDIILEVAAEITDFNFQTLGSYEARVKHNATNMATLMQANNWWQEYPANRDDFIKNAATGKPLKTVESELIEFVEEHFKDSPAILAGNSIHNDRNFIKRWWPLFDLKLHYRMLDVTSLKILLQGKYAKEYIKSNSHRAYDDIQASIAELQYCVDQIRKTTD